ncbi:MAG: hypothetical protein K5989_01640, partial [Lachnospiraceae bacterium]|nr:hypothetical protein [Lachnospiraceae bacterium]
MGIIIGGILFLIFSVLCLIGFLAKLPLLSLIASVSNINWVFLYVILMQALSSAASYGSMAGVEKGIGYWLWLLGGIAMLIFSIILLTRKNAASRRY